HPTSPYSLSFASSSSFFFSCSRHHPAPHSFPTRRSSDLLGAPHLVASRAPGTPFYSSIWELWTVHVPDGFDVTTIRSAADVRNRSEEHTSELQSRFDLVCRLLLEKKKNK